MIKKGVNYNMTHSERYDTIWDKFHDKFCSNCNDYDARDEYHTEYLLIDSCCQQCKNKEQLNKIQQRYDINAKPIYETL